MACSALVPAAQAALAPEAEELRLGDANENRQYQQVLNVAASQEHRLVSHKALRRAPGYDLSDPWLVVPDEDRPEGRKRGRAEQELVLGVPCLVVGSALPVAFLGPVAGAEGECHVRELGGRTRRCPRRQLMPMPTRPAKQGDWALPVGLTGMQSKYNGLRCICGLVGRFPGGSPHASGMWCSFEPTDPTHPPEFVLIAEANLVTLPTPPAGAPRTPWETRALTQPASSSQPMLADESAMECQLALRDDDDDDDDDASAELTDSSEEDDCALVLAPGALVSLQRASAKSSGSQRYGRVEKLQGEGDAASVVFRLLDGKRGEEVKCNAADLTLVPEKELGLAAVCQHCKTAEPEDDAQLLMCEHFSTSCLGCAHLRCLTPPLKKVPKGPWFCQLCSGAPEPSAKRGGQPLQALADGDAPEAGAKAKPKGEAEKAKAKAKAKTNPQAEATSTKPTAKAASKAAAKAKSMTKRKGK